MTSTLAGCFSIVAIACSGAGSSSDAPTSNGPCAPDGGDTDGSSSSNSSGGPGSSDAGIDPSNAVAVTKPGEHALPGARFFQHGRFLVYTAASGTPLTATKVRAFDTTTKQSVDLGDAVGTCGGACVVSPRVFVVSKTGTMAVLREANGWSIVDLATGQRKPVSVDTLETFVAITADGSFVTVKNTFLGNPGAINYYAASGGSKTLTSMGNDPDNFSGVDVGEVAGKPVVVAAVYKGGVKTIDTYPVDGSASSHVGTGEKVWVLGDRVVFYDGAAAQLSMVPIGGGPAVPLSKKSVANDGSDGLYRGALVSPDGSSVVLEGVPASVVSLAAGAITTNLAMNSSDGPVWIDNQAVAFGKVDFETQISQVKQAKLTDTTAAGVAEDAKFVSAGKGRILYGANTAFKSGTIKVDVPGIAALSYTTGDLYDAHVVVSGSDQVVSTKPSTELVGSPGGFAMIRFAFDPKKGNAPMPDNGLSYLPL